MPKGVALRREEDPQEWIDECLNCPLEECIDCRYQASAYHCVESIRGCLPDDKFMRMYNSGEKPRTMGVVFGVPTAFITAVLTQLKLPWKTGGEETGALAAHAVPTSGASARIILLKGKRLWTT